MPSYQHEVLVEMFRERPALAAELLAGPLGVAVPSFKRASLSSAELTDVTPTEYRADVVVTLNVDDAPAFAVVVEVQLGRDQHKRYTWPAYVATLYARLKCPVYLLIVCASAAVAQWCAEKIVVSRPGLQLVPLVLGPDQVPVVTDPEAARRQPQLAVMSTMAHARDTRTDRAGLFGAFLAALEVVDHAHADLYADVVFARLPAAARDYLEDLMTTTAHRYHSEFARRYFDQGEARGRALGEVSALLALLDARGIEVSDAVRAEIAECTDLEQLELWIRRAVTVEKAADLFA